MHIDDPPESATNEWDLRNTHRTWTPVASKPTVNLTLTLTNYLTTTSSCLCKYPLPPSDGIWRNAGSDRVYQCIQVPVTLFLWFIVILTRLTTLLTRSNLCVRRRYRDSDLPQVVGTNVMQGAAGEKAGVTNHRRGILFTNNDKSSMHVSILHRPPQIMWAFPALVLNLATTVSRFRLTLPCKPPWGLTPDSHISLFRG